MPERLTDRLAKLSERYFDHPDEGGDLLSGVDLDELCGLQHEEIDRLKEATLGALAMVEEYGGVAARKTNELEQAQAASILMSNAILAVTQSVQECSSSLAPHVLALVQKACVPSPGQDLLARLTKAEAACAAVLNGGWLDDEEGTTTDGSTPVRDQVAGAAQEKPCTPQ